MEHEPSSGIGTAVASFRAPTKQAQRGTRLGLSLWIEVQRGPSGAVVWLRGSAGMTEAEPLRRRLEALVAEPLPVIVLELSDLDLIGSAGLAALLCARRRSGRPDRLRLAAPRACVLHVIELARLTKLLKVYPSATLALIG